MDYIIWAIKIGIFISIINVWFFRFNKVTPYRAGKATSMAEEFNAYGLSTNIMYLIGGLKTISATVLLVSILYPTLSIYGAAPMAILMLGAIFMHIKVKDPIVKAFPAAIFLLLSIVIILNAAGYIF